MRDRPQKEEKKLRRYLISMSVYFLCISTLPPLFALYVAFAIHGDYPTWFLGEFWLVIGSLSVFFGIPIALARTVDYWIIKPRFETRKKNKTREKLPKRGRGTGNSID